MVEFGGVMNAGHVLSTHLQSECQSQFTQVPLSLTHPESPHIAVKLDRTIGDKGNLDVCALFSVTFLDVQIATNCGWHCRIMDSLKPKDRPVEASLTTFSNP